jgi:hypothetical protein
LATYPDLLDQQVDPLVHFCHYGWKEGRQPNPFFDTLGYSQLQGDLIEQGVNPLLHYMQVGEAANANPSAQFDIKSYRQLNQLPSNESPLRHFLLRHTGEYAQAEPDTSADTTTRTTHGPTITLASLMALMGISPEAEPPTSVSWEAFTSVVQRFLPLLPFDEQWYNAENPDIAAAVANGDMRSAHDHFISNGFFEGRDGIPPEDDSLPDDQSDITS